MSPMVIARRAWVFLTNGAFLARYVLTTVTLLRAKAGDPVTADVSLVSFIPPVVLVSVAVLLSGILLELFGARLAKYVNLGYFLAIFLWSAGLFVGEYILHATNAGGMSAVFLLTKGLPAVLIFGVDFWLYRSPGLQVPPAEPVPTTAH
jgi:hypothetical protein